jgi:NAD(P)-dependent dehydrogenase (short-subunit alcohol dehydrogenase family)
MPTAIITGGAVRIGKALACHLADQGWNLALNYNSSDPAEVLAHAQQAGVTCKTYPGDLSELTFAEGLIGQVVADFNDVQLLINSAANFIQENVEHTSTQTLYDTMALNLMSPYLLMREYKKQVGQGMIVNILDERITKNIPTFAAYSVSKVALEHATKLAAVEWGETVRVNAIAPGLILPPAGHGQEYLDNNIKNVPTKTHGDVADLTRALDYLIASPFVNGEILFVDGGSSKDRLSQN